MPVDIPFIVPFEGERVEMATAVDELVQATVISGMSAGVAAANQRRIDSADQHAGVSDRAWTNAMMMPSVNMAMGFRVAQQPEGYPGKANVSG